MEPHETPEFDTRPVTRAGSKVDVTQRLIAALIDGAVAGILTTVIPGVGGLLGGLYILLRDGLDVEYLRGRSLGKTLMKLRVVREDGQPMDLGTSVRRNWTLSLGLLITVLALIPILGWIAGFFLALVIPIVVIIEAVLVFMDPDGRRFGDRTAGTKVVASPD